MKKFKTLVLSLFMLFTAFDLLAGNIQSNSPPPPLWEGDPRIAVDDVVERLVEQKYIPGIENTVWKDGPIRDGTEEGQNAVKEVSQLLWDAQVIALRMRHGLVSSTNELSEVLDKFADYGYPFVVPIYRALTEYEKKFEKNPSLKLQLSKKTGIIFDDALTGTKGTNLPERQLALFLTAMSRYLDPDLSHEKYFDAETDSPTARMYESLKLLNEIICSDDFEDNCKKWRRIVECNMLLNVKYDYDESKIINFKNFVPLLLESKYGPGNAQEKNQAKIRFLDSFAWVMFSSPRLASFGFDTIQRFYTELMPLYQGQIPLDVAERMAAVFYRLIKERHSAANDPYFMAQCRAFVGYVHDHKEEHSPAFLLMAAVVFAAQPFKTEDAERLADLKRSHSFLMKVMAALNAGTEQDKIAFNRLHSSDLEVIFKSAYPEFVYNPNAEDDDIDDMDSEDFAEAVAEGRIGVTLSEPVCMEDLFDPITCEIEQVIKRISEEIQRLERGVTEPA